MLQNGDFRIRMVDGSDLPYLTQVRTSEHVQSNVGTVVFTNTQLQYGWLEKISHDPTQLYAMFEKIEDNKWVPLGYLRITEIDHKNKSMCVGGDININQSGKGYGKEMYKLILKLGFDTWGMNRLWLLVLEENERAHHLYQKMGFKDEGVQRRAIFKNGKYSDYIMMSILREEYYNGQGNTTI